MRDLKVIFATDINKTVIEAAKSKNYSSAKVDFQIADIFNLANIDKQESLSGGFIWSHMRTIRAENSLMNFGAHSVLSVLY